MAHENFVYARADLRIGGRRRLIIIIAGIRRVTTCLARCKELSLYRAVHSPMVDLIVDKYGKLIV